MVDVIRRNDIAEMLMAFEHSGFGHLTVNLGTVRVAASRRASFPTEPTASAVEPVAGAEIATVAAPRLGIFLACRETDAVRPGDKIDDDTVIGSIRVRRNVTPVKAGRRGIVDSFLVRDGEFVEYGQALLRVQPSNDAVPEGVQ